MLSSSSSMFSSRLRAVLSTRVAVHSTTTVTRTFAAVGDALPSVELHHGFPPKKYDLATFAKDKSVLVVGLPGAFTPT